MKFSVVFLVQHSPRWANPRASATSLAKAALPEGKLLPLPATSIFPPLGDPAQSRTPEVDEEGERREQLTAPLPFLPAKLECLSSPLQARVGAGGSLSNHPHVQLTRQESPRLLGGRGGSRNPGNATGQMREEDLRRSRMFIINCWRIGEYVRRVKGTNKLI